MGFSYSPLPLSAVFLDWEKQIIPKKKNTKVNLNGIKNKIHFHVNLMQQ